MNKQEQIDALRAKLEQAIENHERLLSVLTSGNKPIIITSPEGTWVKNWRDSSGLIKDPIATNHNSVADAMNHSEKPNSCEPDYTHLLPEGYEFCAEQNAEKWVKVEMGKYCNEKDLGLIIPKESFIQSKFYRPIRPIAYHIAVHESVTAEPDPYQVDWSNAPNWADVHCFDANGKGNWYGVKRDSVEWYRCNIGNSEFTLPTGLDWKQSKRLNPKLK